MMKQTAKVYFWIPINIAYALKIITAFFGIE